jgi:hypothetical protein
MTVKSLQTEFFVGIDAVQPALEAVAKVAKKWPGWGSWDEVNPETQGLAHICELRSIKADVRCSGFGRERCTRGVLLR